MWIIIGSRLNRRDVDPFFCRDSCGFTGLELLAGSNIRGGVGILRLRFFFALRREEESSLRMTGCRASVTPPQKPELPAPAAPDLPPAPSTHTRIRAQTP